MSVSNGQPANQSVFNAAFVSKTATSGNTVTGIVSLQNGSSGDTTTNLQQSLSDAKVQVASTATVTSGGTITLDASKERQVIPVVGDAGDQTASVTPFGAGSFVNGHIVTLVGTNDSQKVTLTNNDASNGAILNGTRELGKYQTITLIYMTVLDRWLELGRND